MKSNFFILFTLLTISCNTQDKQLYEFDPLNLTENKITLAEIANDISYIPLDNGFPISSIIYSYYFADSSIYLASKDLGVMVFNREGRMIRKIGSIGRGPGEYLHCTNLAVDEELKIIYIYSGNNLIKVYSLNGDFLRDISVNQYPGYIDCIDILDSKLYAFYFLQFGDSKFNWIILDSTGHPSEMKERSIPVFWSNWGAKSGTYTFDNKLSYWNPYNDTVYTFSSGTRYGPAFLISPGEHRIPKSKIDTDNLAKYLFINYVFETSKYLVIKYGYKKNIIALIDKKTGKSYLNPLETDKNLTIEHGGITNNIDGGLMFQPDNYFAGNDNEYMAGIIQPHDLKLHIGCEEFKNSSPEYPEKKAALQKLADALNETDNPVLMVVKLKK